MADPIERRMELAFRLGSFIPDGASFSFVSGLEEVAAEIRTLAGTEPARAAGLFETFLAGCHENADEIYDSSGSFGQFAGGLMCAWIEARQAAGAAPEDTVARLLAWMDDGPYGFSSAVEKDAAKVFDQAGLAEFEKRIRARFEAAAEQGWVERGIELDQESSHGSGAGYGLSKLHRELLTELGRGNEALDAAWADFREVPSKYSYEELMRFAPAATKLEEAHPDLAARLWRAQGMRILNAKKSKYYDAALSNFERARNCYQRAGLAVRPSCLERAKARWGRREETSYEETKTRRPG